MELSINEFDDIVIGMYVLIIVVLVVMAIIFFRKT